MNKERIYQICNDIAEEMNYETITKKELWAVAKYLMNEEGKIRSEYAAFRSTVICDLSAMAIGISQNKKDKTWAIIS